MRRAVRHAARLAHARVLFARGLLINPAARDAVIGTEVGRAHGAGLGARVTPAMTALVLLMHADHQLGRRFTALGAGENPGRRSGEWPLGSEPGIHAVRRYFPLDALHQDLRVDELERMHDRFHLMATHLLRSTPLM